MDKWTERENWTLSINGGKIFPPLMLFYFPTLAFSHHVKEIHKTLLLEYSRQEEIYDRTHEELGKDQEQVVLYNIFKPEYSHTHS